MKATSKSSGRHIHLLKCLMVALLLAASAHGQDKEQKAFASIPEALRARLVERLELYVAYQQTQNYEKLYDLYSEYTRTRILKGQSREEFAAAFRKGDAEGKSIRMIKFTPTKAREATREGIDVYSIYGKAKLCEQGEMVEKELVIDAELKDGDWYFSVITDVLND